nr:hypothetical protein [Comamonas jiangduensis]
MRPAFYRALDCALGQTTITAIGLVLIGISGGVALMGLELLHFGAP